RIKIGVGIPQDVGADTIDWVTSRPSREDEKVLIAALDKAVEAVPYLISHGPAAAMNKFNG
ncbi:MAG: aminoacyl-tRNA hydrolase, partial [Oscillospiraceae bacterium]|nr:aminoacyl-tRNA hydrolase [Oscillospiraceae bacterium]